MHIDTYVVYVDNFCSPFTAETNCVCNQTKNPWLKELMESC